MTDVPQDVFLSTAAARPWDRRIAIAFVVVSLAGLALAIPYANHSWPATPSFIAAYEAALVVNDLITAVLLIGQVRQMRRIGVLILGCGYLFDALIVVAHSLSFPEVFSAAGLISVNRQTAAWIFIFWHGVFPLFICAYALLAGSRWDTPLTERQLNKVIAIGVIGAIVIAAACTLASTVGIDWLPDIMRGNDYRLMLTSGIAPAIWLISLAALVLLWVRTRGRTVLDLWLMVVMGAWLMDIFVSTLMSTTRYDFGYYAGRFYGLLAASFVLGVLLLEANQLYGRLARALGESKDRNAALEAAVGELEAFSYSVSHDLRAPLRAIDAFSRILLKHHVTTLSSEAREYLQSVCSNAVQMGHLVDDLLAFSRLGRKALVKKPVPTAALVEKVVEEVRQHINGRSVSVSIDKLPDTCGDQALLKQVFFNLVDNAFKYTRSRAHAVVEIGSYDEGGEHVFFVRDNGAGFDMQYADKLFGVFQRLHRAEDFEGTGVGLAIVQRIIQRHGGRIWANAAVESGATFSFTIDGAQNA
jgi:signal transduction histidine kinase